MATSLQVARLVVVVVASTVVGRGAAAPLQWEGIQPVGKSPAARHSHATVIVPTEQSVLYMFGGCLQEPKSSQGRKVPGVVSNDVWAFDQGGQGWEEIIFRATQLGCDLPAAQQELEVPDPRAGHVMVSRRTGAITCGGYRYAEDGGSDSKTFLQDRNGNIDCWWFTPGVPPRWDRLKLDPASSSDPAPAPRFGLSMSFDRETSNVIIFGGRMAKGVLLNDCWTLQEVATKDETGNATYAKLDYEGWYRWSTCDPLDDPSSGSLALRPQARYGQQSVYFHKSLYIVGGFAQDGLRVTAKKDMWILKNLGQNVSWEEMMPTTTTPDARGFHALWISGFKIYLHGGQGPSGLGQAAVLGDTWEFDLFTKEWKQKATSAAVPVMSNLAINPLDNTAHAISFGGRDSEGRPSGRLYTCTVAASENVWKRMYPAGVRPSRRVGNTLVYDQDSARLVTSFGMDDAGLQEDTWILDLTTRMWTCHYGSDPSCTHRTENSRYAGPGRIAFPAQVQAGLYSFLYGGVNIRTRTCVEMGRGSSGVMAVPFNVMAMWAMDVSTLTFLRVPINEAAGPRSTFLASMVAVSEFGDKNNPRTGDFKQPLVLAGGADLSCASSNTQQCTIPAPSNEIWVMDSAPQESVGSSDNMAELDGDDDMLQIVLPTWCRDVRKMSVLWLDAWIMVLSKGKVKTILFDAYDGAIPRLRLYLEGMDSGNYIKLMLSPGKNEKIVKTWGPLDGAFLGTWHHTALTLRMARQFSRTSADPALIITQAFLFVDGKGVNGGEIFLTHDLEKDMQLGSGLSEIIVGGTSPAYTNTEFRNLKGAVDNVRIWWPQCPHPADPSMCNPYGFLYPQTIDGTRRPTTGIQDREVELGHVAQPILDNMFQVAPFDTESLLAQFTFDGDTSDGVVASTSTWRGPGACDDDSTAVCPGCNDVCTFRKCSLFDQDCVESGATDVEAQAEYAKAGTCQCLNVDDCPKNVEGCHCPKNKGLHKVCTTCVVGVCKIHVEPPVYTPPLPPCGPNNEWFDDGYCDESHLAFDNCPMGSDPIDCKICSASEPCDAGRYCNFDAGDTGFCAKCDNNDFYGLNQMGQQNCEAMCFNGGDAVSAPSNVRGAEATVSCDGSCCDSNGYPSTDVSGVISRASSCGGYGNNEYCTWTISSSAEITVQFPTFRTEECCDRVTLYTCENEGNCELATVRGHNDGAGPYVSSTGLFRIRFSSDGSVTEKGFVATWITSEIFVSLTVTLPYSQAEFDTSKQDAYKSAVANAAGTTSDKVEIVSITESRRRAGMFPAAHASDIRSHGGGSHLEVETKILAANANGLTSLTDSLGSGADLESNINSALQQQELSASLGVTDPAASTASGQGGSSIGQGGSSSGQGGSSSNGNGYSSYYGYSNGDGYSSYYGYEGESSSGSYGDGGGSSSGSYGNEYSCDQDVSSHQSCVDGRGQPPLEQAGFCQGGYCPDGFCVDGSCLVPTNGYCQFLINAAQGCFNQCFCDAEASDFYGNGNSDSSSGVWNTLVNYFNNGGCLDYFDEFSEYCGSASALNGEQVCEGHGFDRDTCLSSNCCQWDSYSCWSAIGSDTCTDLILGNRRTYAPVTARVLHGAALKNNSAAPKQVSPAATEKRQGRRKLLAAQVLKRLSAAEKAAQEAPQEWERWTTHDFYRHSGATEWLDATPERAYFYHRSTGQLRWDPPLGWEEHMSAGRGSHRKLLSADSGEGQLCHPGGRKDPFYPPGGPELNECPSVDGTPMRCERLDPMFCPRLQGDVSLCRSWDCKCYGPGNNDNSNISGTLGSTVINGEKSTASCVCPTYQYYQGDGKDATLQTARMEKTPMPFVDKADQFGDRVMVYECCADWFSGYQCTLWDYANGSSPVCLHMYNNHEMLPCAASTCCSAYINTHVWPWESSDGNNNDPYNDPSCDPFCEPYMDWCEPCCDPSCYYSMNYGDPYCIPCDLDEPGSGPGSGSGLGPGPDMGGGGDECFLEIYGGGTFVGSFHPHSHADAPQAQAQLLASHREGAGGRPGKDAAETHVRMNENIVFRGRFIPDQKMPNVEEAQSSMHAAGAADAGGQSMPSAPQHPPTAHTATARSAEPALLRDPEARQGRPGAPGGQKEQRDAAKARARERAKAPSGDAATAVRLSHRRRLLQSNSSSNSTSNNGNSSSTVLNANQKILGTVTGKIDVCQNGEPSGGMATVSDWFLSTINGDTTVINPSGAESGPYTTGDLDVTDLVPVYVKPGTPPRCGWMVGWVPCPENPPGVDWPTCEVDSWELGITVRIKDAAHRNKIVSLLTTDLLAEPWTPCRNEITDDEGISCSEYEAGGSEEGNCHWGSCGCGCACQDYCGVEYFPMGNQYINAGYNENAVAFWSEPPELVYCGDSVVQPDNDETCDAGEGNMNQYSACNDECRCNDGFAFNEELGQCLCTAVDEGATIDAIETSSVQGDANDVTVAIQLTTAVVGLNADSKAPTPTVVTISGLDGAIADTPAGAVGIRCRHSMSTVWTSADGQPECKVGLFPQGNASSTWRYGTADWNAAEGTLKFTVLQDLQASSDPRERRFEVAITLTNAAKLQPMRRLQVAVCRVRQASDESYQNLGLFSKYQDDGALSETGYILGASAKRVYGPPANTSLTETHAARPLQTVTFYKQVTIASAQQELEVLTVRVPNTSLPINSELIIFAMDAVVDKGLTLGQSRLIPFFQGGNIDDVLAGAGNTMMRLVLRDRTTKTSLMFLDDKVEVEFAIDQSVVRTRGQCYTPESNTVTVCLPGYVGIYRNVLIPGDEFYWEFVPDNRLPTDTAPGQSSRMYSTLSSKLPNDAFLSTSYIVLAVSPCNDYKGGGRAGGDAICLDDDVQRERAYASLGGGTVSKMPALTATSRPLLDSQAKLDEYFKSISEGTDYVPRREWVKVDLTRYPMTTLPARFGHAMATVSGTRVLIYGGIGCGRYDPQSQHCLESVVLNDLWEFDLLRWSGSGNPLRILNLSPSLRGLAGVSLIAIPGEDHRVLTFGGASAMYPLLEVLRLPLVETADKFEYRELQFRASKAVNATILGKDAISSASVASNETHVILYGGYLGNTRTSAVHTYTLSASSAELGLEQTMILANGPSARSMPGVIKPDDTTLLMYGGVKQNETDGVTHISALGDLWQFDLSTQSWLKVHDTTAASSPRAFSAFGTGTAGDDTFIFTWGGLRDGFHPEHTFRTAGGAVHDVKYQVSIEGRVYMASQVTHPSKAYRESWMVVTPTYSGGSDACCNYDYSCPEADRGVGCVPDARAFHQMNPGFFTGGRLSMIVYGGLDRTGRSLGDLWVMDAEDQSEGKSYYLILRNVTVSTFTAAHRAELARQIARGWGMADVCSSQRAEIQIQKMQNLDGFGNALGDAEPTGEGRIMIEFTSRPQDFENCVKPVMVTPGSFESAVNLTDLQGIMLDIEWHADALEGLTTELRMPWYKYRSNEWCQPGRSACLRALCQSTGGPAETDSSGRLKYCYDDCNGDGINEYQLQCRRQSEGQASATMQAQCGTDFSCASPGRRWGHASTTMLLGETTTLLVFGGESTNWDDNTNTLTMDIHMAHFTASFATWAEIRTKDRNGDPCAWGVDPGGSFLCPQARRDASIKVMSNDASNNGRLLVFGGLGAASAMPTSVGRAYLEGSTSAGVVALDDLWYLDLTPLRMECVRGEEQCELLQWIKVDVPGEKPGGVGRWGAGMVLDLADNLYIIGGSTFDASSREYSVLSDIYIFQLTDPYYKYCSATGQGLLATRAGVLTPFYIQCRDAFGRGSPRASFAVDISGKEGQPTMKPSPVSLGNGEYKVQYTAFTDGAYSITIKVGRGGSDYMEVIEGVDLQPSNEVHDYTFRPKVSGADPVTPQTFDLTVEPGDTHAPKSVADGDAITSNTAGVIGTFLITAHDAFNNRRPGGDSVTSLMTLLKWTANDLDADTPANPDELPETGSVLDNNNGLYSVTYRITKAGVYQHSIAIANTVGAGTPVILRVDSDVADISRTYVYGTLLTAETGKPATVYIQTRDQFGNFPRFHYTEKPCTGYPLSDTCDQQIDYDVCQSVGDDKAIVVPCPLVVTDVSKVLEYGIGPTASYLNDDTGEPYFGLYQVTVYPLGGAGGKRVFPMVYHNGTYVRCYFDSGELAGTNAADPGHELANACADLNTAQASRRGMSPVLYHVNQPGHGSSRRDGASEWAQMPADPVQVQFGIIREERWDLLSREYADANGAFGASAISRRAVTEISWEDQVLEVKQSFQEPDTAELEKWTLLAPILCCIIGVVVAVLHAAWDTYELRRDRKVHAMFEHFAEKEKDEAMDVDEGAVQGSVTETVHPTSSQQNEASNDLILQNVEHGPSNLNHAGANGPDDNSRQQDEKTWIFPSRDGGTAEGKGRDQEGTMEEQGPAANGLPPHMHLDETSVGAREGSQAQQEPRQEDRRDESHTNHTMHRAPIPAPAVDVPIPQPLVPKAPPAPA